MSAVATPDRVTLVPPGAARPRRRWPALGAVAAVLGGTVAIAAHGSRYGNWIMDDAAITFAYARSVAEGDGPVLHPGAPPVEGYSNPTWMVLLVLGRLAGLFDRGTLFGIPDYVFYPKALALLCCAGVLTAAYFAAKVVSPRPRLVTFLAGLALAANPSFVLWCFSGLENSLYALVVVLLAVTALRAVVSGRLLTPAVAVATGLYAALAALTRPDGLVYAGVYPILVLVFASRARSGASVRAGLLSTAAFAVVFGGYLAYRWVEFGRLVPNTAVAKSQPVPEFTNLGKAAELIQYAGWVLVLVVTACVAVVLTRPSRARTALITLSVPLLLAVVAYCVLRPDWMGEYRFATPVWAVGALAGALSVVEALRLARGRGRLALTALLVVGAALSGTQFHDRLDYYRAGMRTPLCVVAERDGRPLNGMADLLGLRQGSAAVVDLGGVAMTTRLHLVDLAGLADARTADLLSAADRPGLRDHVLDEVRPDLIALPGVWNWTLGLPDDPRFTRDYALVLHGLNGEPLTRANTHKNVSYWVRRDALRDPGQLTDLRAYATRVIPPVLARNATAPRRDCGPTLERGQTPLG